MTRRFVLVCTVVLAAGGAAAQDANYWDNQYGTKAQLLGGLVVGSPSDLSSTFYNPAWLALRTDPSLLLTTQALEYSRLEVRNFAEAGAHPAYSRFQPSPSFLAGRFRAGRDGGWSVTWSYVEKMRFRFDAAARRLTHDPAPPPDGALWFSGEAYRQVETNDLWYGVTFARPLGENTSFGITPYVAYRSQKQRIQASAQALDAVGGYADISVVDQFEYSHFRALAKLGLAFDYEPVAFGIAVTTPSLGILGGGSVYRNAAGTGLDPDGDGTPDDYLASSDQRDLDARWKSPLSVAAGASCRFGRTGLHCTVEWFDGVEGFDVVSAGSFASQSDGNTIVPNLRISLHSLVNVGLGLDHRFSGKFSAFAGVRTDFSAQGEDPESDVLMSSWDLWHVSSGASFTFLGIELTTGLEYSFANGHTIRDLEISGETDPAIVGRLQETDVRYDRLKLLVGFDLALLTGGS